MFLGARVWLEATPTRNKNKSDYKISLYGQLFSKM